MILQIKLTSKIKWYQMAIDEYQMYTYTPSVLRSRWTSACDLDGQCKSRSDVKRGQSLHQPPNFVYWRSDVSGGTVPMHRFVWAFFASLYYNHQKKKRVRHGNATIIYHRPTHIYMYAEPNRKGTLVFYEVQVNIGCDLHVQQHIQNTYRA